MDPVLTALTNFGLGGCLVAVQVWFLRHLVTKTIPDLLLVHREELTRLREDADRLREDTERRHDQVLGRLDVLSQHAVNLRDNGCAHRPRP